LGSRSFEKYNYFCKFFVIFVLLRKNSQGNDILQYLDWVLEARFGVSGLGLISNLNETSPP
jgi:hypothetical protein